MEHHSLVVNHKVVKVLVLTPIPCREVKTMQCSYVDKDYMKATA